MPPPSKRRKTTALEEISFDSTARQDYLTGFRKRKQQRIKHAKEYAAKRERELKIEERRQVREQRKQDLEKHVQTVGKMLREAEDGATTEDSDAVGQGSDVNVAVVEPSESIDKAQLDEHSREDEYVDEEKYTTVTIKPMDESDSEGEDMDDEQAEEDDKPTTTIPDQSKGQPPKKRSWTKDRPAKDRIKKKRKKFRYETKAERKVTRAHEKKNSAAARARRKSKPDQH